MQVMEALFYILSVVELSAKFNSIQGCGGGISEAFPNVNIVFYVYKTRDIVLTDLQ